MTQQYYQAKAYSKLSFILIIIFFNRKYQVLPRIKRKYFLYNAKYQNDVPIIVNPLTTHSFEIFNKSFQFSIM